MTKSQKVTLVAKILKKRYPLSQIDEVLDAAQQIVNELEKNEFSEKN